MQEYEDLYKRAWLAQIEEDKKKSKIYWSHCKKRKTFQ